MSIVTYHPAADALRRSASRLAGVTLLLAAAAAPRPSAAQPGTSALASGARPRAVADTSVFA
ncbi:MAG: hypothetical protein P3C09_05550, partial [Gemmatimonadota bacterium]|nr:hypothetical protein [Gemmatimonadota bacterium]